MNHSGFVDEIEFIESVVSTGATSLSYVVRMEGKQYFMKQLRPEYAAELRYRTMFYKEYETGRRISNSHVVHYICIGENADGLYLLMEHINGITLEEKVKMPHNGLRMKRIWRVFSFNCSTDWKLYILATWHILT